LKLTRTLSALSTCELFQELFLWTSTNKLQLSSDNLPSFLDLRVSSKIFPSKTFAFTFCNKELSFNLEIWQRGLFSKEMAFASPNLFPRLTLNIWRNHYLISFNNFHSFPRAFFFQPFRISFIFLSTFYHIGFFFGIKGFFSLDIVSRAIWKRSDICKPWTFISWEFVILLTSAISWLQSLEIFSTWFSSINLGILQRGIFKKNWHLQAPTLFQS